MSIMLPGGKRDLINKASSSIFISVAAASVVLAFSLVAINMLIGQMGYNNRVHSEKEEARDTLLANIEKATALEASFISLEAASPLIPVEDEDVAGEVKKNSAVVLDALPRRYDFPALRTSVDELASISGVRVEAYRGDDLIADAITSVPNPTPQEILFGVTVEGNYQSVIQFMVNMDNTIRPMQVTKLRFAGSDSLMSATMDIVTFYQPSVDLNVQTKVVK